MAAEGYYCATCGEWHAGLPYGFSFRAPDAWLALRRRDRLLWRSVLGEEQCWIRDGRHFLKANVELPLHGSDEVFSWIVWMQISREDWKRADERWRDPRRVEEPPYEGRVANAIPGYPETTWLRGAVHTRELGIRPFVTLEDSDHPLVAEQRHGITPERHREIAALVLHSGDPRFG